MVTAQPVLRDDNVAEEEDDREVARYRNQLRKYYFQKHCCTVVSTRYFCSKYQIKGLIIKRRKFSQSLVFRLQGFNLEFGQIKNKLHWGKDDRLDKKMREKKMKKGIGVMGKIGIAWGLG